MTANTMKFRLATLMLAAALAVHAAARADGPDEDGGAGEQIIIAALPFTDASEGGKYAPLAEAMGDMLVSFLSQSDELVFVERTDLDKVLQEQDLSLGGLVDEKTRAEVGRLLGAQYILTGAVTVLDEALRINAHLLDVESTRVVRSEDADGTVDDLLGTVAAVARECSQQMLKSRAAAKRDAQQ